MLAGLEEAAIQDAAAPGSNVVELDPAPPQNLDGEKADDVVAVEMAGRKPQRRPLRLERGEGADADRRIDGKNAPVVVRERDEGAQVRERCVDEPPPAERHRAKAAHIDDRDVGATRTQELDALAEPGGGPVVVRPADEVGILLGQVMREAGGHLMIGRIADPGATNAQRLRERRSGHAVLPS
jgi:hypothetical protein